MNSSSVTPERTLKCEGAGARRKSFRCPHTGRLLSAPLRRPEWPGPVPGAPPGGNVRL
jgi:hypothetical protein